MKSKSQIEYDRIDRMLNNEDYSPDECTACNGQGHSHGIHDDHIKACPECGGSGKTEERTPEDNCHEHDRKEFREGR